MKFVKSNLPFIFAPLAGLLYLFTAAPSLLWLDAPRFVSAIVTWGIANPPEPLYVMLAKPFTYLPFGSYIFRIQIFSALCAVLVLILLYKLMVKFVPLVVSNLTKSKDGQSKLLLTAIFSTLMLAFSYQFWSQAQNVETFILVTLIEVIILYLLFFVNTKLQFFINISIISALMGLATGTNPVIASIIPSILWVMWAKRKFWTLPGFAAWVIIGVVAIVAVHLYIPIRAHADPFLNYWRATTFEGVWGVSTGGGLNVYVPELGRINGFTGSPEVFFRSTWHFIEMWFLKFTPALLPFMIAGGWFLWKKSKFYFIFWGLIIFTNWIFAGLYFSGNQESWFLMSDISWVVFGGLGYLWAMNGGLEEALSRIKGFGGVTGAKFRKFTPYLILVLLVPLIFWFGWLYRRDWYLTDDYIQNLYRPMGDEPSIIFGSSDLYDSVSFYVHDIPATPVYKPNVIPITDNLFYILKWYRDNLKSTTDLKFPDDSKLKYDSADEYSRFANEFFEMNLDKYKIFITTPAMRNNFLQVYNNQEDLTGSLKVDQTKFKLVPQGILFQVVRITDKVESDPKLFEFTFRNGFPKNKPKMLEQTYNTEMTGMINEFAYALEALGDSALGAGKTEDAFKFYQRAYEFNPKNAEIISRLGNYYGTVGDHAKAAEFFEKALKIEPRNIGLLFNLAIAYENTGRVDKAISSLNKVLQYAKSNSQIGQLAKTRLDILKSATPSAVASASGGVQSQLLPPSLPDGQKLFMSEALNLQFAYPGEFTVKEAANGLVTVSNNLKGKDELTFTFYSRKMAAGEDLEAFSGKLPFGLGEAPVLITQPLQIPGFQALGKTYGTGDHLTFVLLLQAKDQGIGVKIYPGDSNKTVEFNQILSSIKTIK